MDLSIARTREVLSRTPATLRAFLSGLGPEWVERPYGPGTWAARDVVAHLIHAERTDWIPRARHILEHGESRPFEPFDRNGYLAEARDKPLNLLLDEFQTLRAGALTDLDRLERSDAVLGRTGRHPALGPVTLGNLLATWAVHDLNHLAQIAKAMAYQYQTEVGPWKAYLSILAPPNPR